MNTETLLASIYQTISPRLGNQVARQTLMGVLSKVLKELEAEGIEVNERTLFSKLKEVSREIQSAIHRDSI